MGYARAVPSFYALFSAASTKLSAVLPIPSLPPAGSLLARMTDTPEEHAPGKDVGCGAKEVDIGLKLAELPGEILLQLAETLGNPLALLVSKAHLSKAFCEAARYAQGLLEQADLREWSRTVDDAAVAAVVSKCTQLLSLNLGGCRGITDEAAKAVASGCLQLTSLSLDGCDKITDTAVVVVASECKQLSSLNLSWCNKITDAAVVAVASGCKQLSSLRLGNCGNITDAAVVAVASGARSSRRSTCMAAATSPRRRCRRWPRRAHTSQ